MCSGRCWATSNNSGLENHFHFHCPKLFVHFTVNSDAGKEGVTEPPIAMAPQMIIDKVWRDAEEELEGEGRGTDVGAIGGEFWRDGGL